MANQYVSSTQMSKWLKRIGVAAVAMIFAGALAIAYDRREIKTVIDHYEKNEALRTVKGQWPGTPVDEDGKFVNYEHPFVPKMSDVLRWKLSGNEFADQKKNDRERLEVRDPSAFLRSRRDGILWLGHASFFIRLDGVCILIDPIFGTPPLVRRFVEVPSPLPLIEQVDYVLLSHDHRDHADETTLRQIAEKFPQAEFLGGLRMDDILNQWKMPGQKVETAGWFQQFDLPESGPHIYFVPVRHWSRRGLFDTNKRLWGGYVLQGKKATIFFGGDSGYGRHYKDLAEVFPAIDYFLIGIGAYEPRWFMEPMHNSPADAVKAFVDSGARTLVPMHYGTFDLSDEPPSAPLRDLRKAAAEAGLTDKIKALTINESLEIPE